MASVEEHYARHLGPVYAWMLGDIDAALTRAVQELDALALPARGTAIDLGAGIGLHAVALARRGFTVTAIDSDAALRCRNWPGARAHCPSAPSMPTL